MEFERAPGAESGTEPSTESGAESSTESGTEFRILGPVEVHDARSGRRTVPPGTKQRTLLAAFVVEAGRVLTVERLADEVWGDSPPVKAANAVQAHVARLRRVLQASSAPDTGAAPGSRTREREWITTEPLGYLLRLTGATTDAERFRRLSAEGRARAASDPAHAAGLLTDALSLWRGSAFQDCVPGAICSAEAASLEEHRLTVVEALYEVRLRSPGHEGITGELERLTDEHPLRERFYDLLMVALYQTGRRTEALGVYERARRRFAEELGVAPSPALRGRLEAILRHPGAADGSDAPLLGLGTEIVRLGRRIDELSREHRALLRRFDALAEG